MKSLGRSLVACVVILGVLAASDGALVAGPAGAPQGFVSGVVRDAAGVPVPSIWIRTEAFRDRLGDPLLQRSDIEGRFRFDGLPEGKVVLRVLGAASQELRSGIEVDTRTGFLVETTTGTKDLAVVVEPGPQLLVRIAGYEAPREGERRFPLETARLVWREAEEVRLVRHVPVSKDGGARFVQLPPGRTFELWCAAGGGRAVRIAGLVAGDREVLVEAKAAKAISGRVVVQAKDKPRLRWADVTAEAYPGLVVGRVHPTPDGTFTIGDLPEGTYTVRAAFNQGEVLDSPTVTVPAGTDAVVLNLPSP